MKSSMPSGVFAVLSGDLINSRSLDVVAMQSLVSQFNKGIELFSSRYRPRLLLGPDFFRGDSWQIILDEPSLSVTLALFIQAWLKAHTQTDTRIAIGIGTVTHLASNHITESSGPAFELSGLGLDEMNETDCLGLIRAHSIKGPPQQETELIMSLLDRIVIGCSPPESFAVFHAILGNSQEISAQDSPVNLRTGKKPSRQAIAAALRRADWRIVNRVILWFSNATKQT